MTKTERPHPEDLLDGGLDLEPLMAEFDAAVDAAIIRGADKSKFNRKFRRPPLTERMRPYTKLTGHRVKKICEALSAGMPKISSAEAAGVDESTLEDWWNHGREALAQLESGEEVDGERWLLAACAVAFDRHWFAGEEAHFEVIENASTAGDWKASVEILQRTRRMRYAKHKSIETEVRHVGGIRLKLEIPEPPHLEGKAHRESIEALAAELLEDGMLAGSDRLLLEERGFQIPATVREVDGDEEE